MTPTPPSTTTASEPWRDVEGRAFGKVAIRDEGAFVVAYLSEMDGSEREEIGRVHGLMVRMVPGAFEKWKDAMAFVGITLIEASVGGKAIEVHELPPAMTEGGEPSERS